MVSPQKPFAKLQFLREVDGGGEGGGTIQIGPERSTMGQVASAVGLATQDGDDGMCECCGQEWVAIVRVCSVDLSSLALTAIVAVCACWCVRK